MDHADVILLKQVDHGTFHKLLIDWQRLVPAMEAHGGSAVFGTWAQWSDPFDLLHLQEKWTGSAFQHDAQMIRQNKSLGEDLAFLGRLSEVRLHEKINLSTLEAYARARTDRRQDLLDAYLTRHRRDGFSNGDYSTIEVEYYSRPYYGRLIARGASGQKITREARMAAFSPHCVEIDAPCCHPRLLVQKLRDAGLWDDLKYPMLGLVVLHCNNWRQCLATYSDYTVTDAKVELIRIFYGGRPNIEAPFLLKLCDEVQRAAVALLRTPEASWFSDLYGDRPNPEFSRLSAMLSFEEAKLLQIVHSRLDDQVQVLIFDGCYIDCNDLAVELDIVEACRACGDQMIPMDVKSWSSQTEVSTLAHMLVRQKPSSWSLHTVASEQQHASCLHYAISFLQPDCDIDLVAVTEEDGCISAKDFNDQMMYASQRALSEGYRMIVQNDINLVGLKNSSEVRFCHQIQSDRGHWWGINFMADSQVMLVDSECNGRHLVTDFDNFIRLASTMQNMTWFRLDIRPHSWIHPEHEAYNLRGSGPLKRPAGALTSSDSTSASSCRTLTTPLRHCIECGALLQTERSIEARLYTLNGHETVCHLTKRCTYKPCRVIHHYNYSISDGYKMNTILLEEVDVIFVNPKTGFPKNFLEYHAALQFRGGLSIHVIAYAQKEALWKDSNEHVRWRREYSAAQLYFNVLSVAEIMHETYDREKLLQYTHEIDVANPLANDFMAEYTRWWRANVCSEEEASLMKDIVIDGHEKVSSKCAHSPPKRAGRPKSNGIKKRRNNGWFMAVHPGTGLILGLREMIDPENNNIAVDVLNDVAYMVVEP